MYRLITRAYKNRRLVIQFYKYCDLTVWQALYPELGIQEWPSQIQPLPVEPGVQTRHHSWQTHNVGDCGRQSGCLTQHPFQPPSCPASALLSPCSHWKAKNCSPRFLYNQSLGCDLDSTDQVHLAKTWIQTKLSGDWPNCRIYGTQHKKKTWGPPYKNEEQTLFPPVCGFSPNLSGWVFFFFFVCYLMLHSQNAGTLRYERTQLRPGALPTTQRRCGLVAAGFPLPSFAGPKHPEVQSGISLPQGLPSQPTGDGRTQRRLPSPCTGTLSTWIDPGRRLPILLPPLLPPSPSTPSSLNA